jgi:hypothetical protein
VPRLACTAALLALLVAGCGGGSDTETATQAQAPTTTAATTTAAEQPTVTKSSTRQPTALAAGHRGPHYFETPSHNIGCYVSRHDARCDIRERSWSPPPEPKSCKKIGLDYGQGLVIGPNHAEFVCAGDTTLGGPVVLPYGSSAQRGTILCLSRTAGITCRNTANGHGFFLSRARYRIF